MKSILIFLLKGYKNIISPGLVVLFGKSCRHSTTCSEYALRSISEKGVIVGLFLSVKRFLSCNYFVETRL